jgi:hypothetical protein
MGCNDSLNDDVSGGIYELWWRAVVATGSCITGELRGSDMRQKDGWKTRERWSSPKRSNGGGVAAKSGRVDGASVS